jgi:hypothetical protein
MTVPQQRLLAALAANKDPYAYLRLGAEWNERAATLATAVGHGWIKKQRGEYRLTEKGRKIYN